MIKFLKEICIYITITFLVTNVVIFYFIKKSPGNFLDYPYEYSFYTYHINQINKVSSYHNLIVGDSKGQCLSPKILGLNWINLSEHASGFFQAYHTIKKYSLHNEIDTLLLYYTPTTVTDFNDREYLDKTMIPSGFINFQDIKTLETIESKYGHIISNATTINPFELKLKQIERELKYFHFPFSYSRTFLTNLSFYFSGYKDFEAANAPRLKFTIENLGQAFSGDSPYNKSFNYEFSNINLPCKPDSVELSYFDSIITFSKVKRIEVYLAASPINETTYKSYQNSIYQKSVASFYKQLKEKYPTLHLIDEPVLMPNTIFGDSLLHPNKKGSIVLTNQIKEKLRLTNSNSLIYK